MHTMSQEVDHHYYSMATAALDRPLQVLSEEAEEEEAQN